MSEYINVILFVLGIAMTLLGWFARTLWSAVVELKDDLSKLKEDLPVYYIRKDDFKEIKDMIMNTLRRIESKVDNKADKT